MTLLGPSVWFRYNRSTTDQIFCIPQILQGKWEYNETVYQLFVEFKNTCDSVRREILYTYLTDSGVSMQLVRVIEVCLNETYNNVNMGKHSYDDFPNQNDLIKEMSLHACFQIFFRMPLVRSKKIKRD
jgi:hypothetical protein